MDGPELTELDASILTPTVENSSDHLSGIRLPERCRRGILENQLRSLFLDLNEIYRQARDGDKAAEEQLCKQLLVSFRVIVQRRVWDRMDGEDVVQQALVTILDKYQTAEITSSFAAWAHTVLKNKIMDYFKMKQLRDLKMEKFVGWQETFVVPAPEPGLKLRIKDCLARINRSHKQYARILNLHFQGYSTEEICGALGITRNNFYVSLSRARTMLEVCLNQKEANS
jgi:RNA polymerase sigma factor (sigma-70 family)